MTNKFVLMTAGFMLAGTVVAAAQQGGAPSHEQDRTGATTDASQNAAYPSYESGTIGLGGGSFGQGNLGSAMSDRSRAQAGSAWALESPQGEERAQPRTR